MSALLTLPNILTGLRVLLIPLVISLASSGCYITATSLLTFSLLLDFFDGYFARKLGQSSHFGAIFDPVADKTVVLTYFAFLFLQTELVPIWFLLLVFVRNLSQLSVIPVLSWLKISFKVKPKFLPKLATAMSFIGLAIGMLVFGIQSAGESMNYKKLFEFLWWFIIGTAALLEAYVLVTFLPRYIQIIRKQHDTFE